LDLKFRVSFLPYSSFVACCSSVFRLFFLFSLKSRCQTTCWITQSFIYQTGIQNETRKLPQFIPSTYQDTVGSFERWRGFPKTLVSNPIKFCGVQQFFHFDLDDVRSLFAFCRCIATQHSIMVTTRFILWKCQLCVCHVLARLLQCVCIFSILSFFTGKFNATLWTTRCCTRSFEQSTEVLAS